VKEGDSRYLTDEMNECNKQGNPKQRFCGYVRAKRDEMPWVRMLLLSQDQTAASSPAKRRTQAWRSTGSCRGLEAGDDALGSARQTVEHSRFSPHRARAAVWPGEICAGRRSKKEGKISYATHCHLVSFISSSILHYYEHSYAGVLIASARLPVHPMHRRVP
jgi:hypothetical protein